LSITLPRGNVTHTTDCWPLHSVFALGHTIPDVSADGLWAEHHVVEHALSECFLGISQHTACFPCFCLGSLGSVFAHTLDRLDSLAGNTIEATSIVLRSRPVCKNGGNSLAIDSPRIKPLDDGLAGTIPIVWTVRVWVLIARRTVVMKIPEVDLGALSQASLGIWPNNPFAAFQTIASKPRNLTTQLPWHPQSDASLAANKLDGIACEVRTEVSMAPAITLAIRGVCIHPHVLVSAPSVVGQVFAVESGI